MNHLVSALLIAALPAWRVCAAEMSVQAPLNDRIVLAPRVDVSGTGFPDGGIVRVTVDNGSAATATIVSGRWSAPGLVLVSGINVVEARVDGSAPARVLVVRGSGIARRPTQRVRFLWRQGVDDQLRQIARGTLNAEFDDTQLNAFAAAVRRRTVEIFADRYRGIADVEIVEGEGEDVHTIQMNATANTVFGSSPGDCGNRALKQTSLVYVGTYRASMVNSMRDRQRSHAWAPMARADTTAQRIEDVAHALGRTSAHEFGHSLGLTADAGDCRWMNGCDDWHNCDEIDEKYKALANRFNNGWHVMDPGGKTENNSRLAEPSRRARAATRTPARFEEFSASYLAIIHPPR